METNSENTNPKKSRELREQERIIERIEKLSYLRGLDGAEVTGYVYRENWDKTRVSLPPLTGVLMDHEFAPIYGPGRFFVSYFCREDSDEGEGKLKSMGSVQYSIGIEYAEIHREFCRNTGRQCHLDGNAFLPGMQRPQGGLGDLLEPEKMKAAAGFLASLKLILHPDNGGTAAANEKLMIEMIRALGNKQQSAPMGEMIVSEALKMITHKAPEVKAPAMIDQVEQLLKLKDALGSLVGNAPAQDEIEDSSPMEKMIGKALDNLPELLKMFNGNVQAAATEAKKKHPIEAALIRVSPNLQAQFYNAMRERYGAQMADQWASSYGIQPPAIIEVERPQPVKQAAPNWAAAGVSQVNGVMQL